MSRLGIREFAEHIIKIANEEFEGITNIKLNKVMFFTIGLYVRDRNGVDDLIRRLYIVPFDKWRYGPVMESVYDRYRVHGGRVIDSDNVCMYKEFEPLNAYIRRLMEEDVHRLISVSHQMEAWRRVRDEVLDGKYVEGYSLEEIEKDFKGEEN